MIDGERRGGGQRGLLCRGFAAQGGGGSGSSLNLASELRDLGVKERILWLSLTGYHASGTNHRTATCHDQTADW